MTPNFMNQDNHSSTKPFYAHSREGYPEEEWQTLEDHQQAVAKLAANFAAAFCSTDLMGLAAWLHDIGKAHPTFQTYLLRENGLDASEYDGEGGGGRVNHAAAGAILAMNKHNNVIGKTLAYLVAGHHAGLLDWAGNQASLGHRLESEKTLLQRIPKSIIEQSMEMISSGNILPPGFAMQCREGKAIAYHLWVRMIFSCLTDADFLDTEAFMDKARSASRHVFPALNELKTRLDSSMENMVKHAPDTPVNQARSAILAACRKAALQESGFFSLTVPTGGGKTLSGTVFAMDHAVLHGKSRIIYVIPYTSIIEQTADILRERLGKENVLEHHSNISQDNETIHLQLAAQNWDAPVIVTTSVQFFESLYAAKPGRCRKLHNMANSVVVLDEAQLLPLEWLHPCVEALNRLVADYGVTVVLSTATQPALPNLDQIPREIIPDPASLYKTLKRTDIRFPDDINNRTDWPTLATELAAHPQVLCIVNRRQDCYELWKAMPPETIHLSALMCGAHRSKAIKKIKRKLLNGETCRVISTQLVEAGVDMDFPVVYRALAGLDSINQAAGRCNREGKLAPALGNVHVFVPPKASPIGLLRKGEDTTRELVSLPDFTADTPESFTRYFQQYYAGINDMGGNWLHEKLVKDVNPDGNVQFRTAGDEFRIIKDCTTPIIVRYAGNDDLIKRLCFGGPSREIMRALQRFTVNVYPQTAQRLEADGHVRRCHHDILIQEDSTLYKEAVGLDIYRENYAAEELMY